MDDHHAMPQSKPPISRPNTKDRDKCQRKTSEKASAPGSLDRRRHHHAQSRHERDMKSRSSHVIKSPPRLDDYMTASCQGWCCDSTPAPCYENFFHRRHERADPQRYGSSPMLVDQQRCCDRGSHSDIFGECGGPRYRHEGPPPPAVACCSYHVSMPSPCYYYPEMRGYHWTPPQPFLTKVFDQRDET